MRPHRRSLQDADSHVTWWVRSTTAWRSLALVSSGVRYPNSGCLRSLVPVGTAPLQLRATPNGRELFVANQGDGTVSVINPGTDNVTATIPVGANPYDTDTTLPTITP
jgi:YVTN family beta-propeller protein